MSDTLPERLEVRTAAELAAQPEEYRQAVRKIVVSHTVNELYGATVFDEPAIALAPTPYDKWLACRIAMEEYGHHVRFKEVGLEMGIGADEMTPAAKRPLSIFDYPLKTWPQFCVIKLLADLAEILQVEDLAHCSYVPLRRLSRMTMPEERFHAEFGLKACTELCRSKEGRQAVQAAIDEYFPYLPAFFGKAGSKNNALFRRWGIKLRTNEEMRDDFMARARELVVDKLGLRLPEVRPEAA